jgi:hypothetical protein
VDLQVPPPVGRVLEKELSSYLVFFGQLGLPEANPIYAGPLADQGDGQRVAIDMSGDDPFGVDGSQHLRHPGPMSPP